MKGIAITAIAQPHAAAAERAFITILKIVKIAQISAPRTISVPTANLSENCSNIFGTYSVVSKVLLYVWSAVPRLHYRFRFSRINRPASKENRFLWAVSTIHLESSQSGNELPHSIFIGHGKSIFIQMIRYLSQTLICSSSPPSIFRNFL